MVEISKLVDAWDLTDKDILGYLLDYWQLTTYQFIGRIDLRKINEKDYGRLKDVMTMNLISIEYPFYSDTDWGSIQSSGIFIGGTVPPKFKDAVVLCRFYLASLEERRKKNNPFLISCKKESLTILNKIDKEHLIFKDDQLLILDSIKQGYINTNKKILEAEIDHVLIDKKQEVQIEEDKINSLLGEIAKLEEIELKNQKSLEQYSQKKDNIISEINVKNNQIKKLAVEEFKLNNKIEELRGYIKERASWFRKLNFITNDFYNSLSDTNNSEKIDEHTITFDSIGNNFTLLVNYIHSYTFSKNIIYPRFLIEDFLTLLRTNDFIVLSGLSGSGKTQIVKSFADALGGFARIIPVKPNWTSSEDLLGYYNPLQKSYLSTPFLDALIEANRNPSKLYLICLDEMNLARVEYYFADFLSSLESRKESPEIDLYSAEESEHIISEFKSVIQILDEAKGKISEDSITDFGQLLSIEEVNNKLKSILGLNEHESFLSLHYRIRRMLSGVLNIPNKLLFPSNVRIIGAVNIDETTHYLSPKVLDRAHILRFNNPLKYDYNSIQEEINNYGIENPTKVFISASDFIPKRTDYPPYDRGNHIVVKLSYWAIDYLEKINIDIGLRSLRQSILYSNLLTELDVDVNLALNNIIRHKILPRLSVDGNKKIVGSDETYHKVIEQLYKEMHNELKEIKTDKLNNSVEEFEVLIRKAKNSDLIYNYWH